MRRILIGVTVVTGLATWGAKADEPGKLSEEQRQALIKEAARSDEAAENAVQGGRMGEAVPHMRRSLELNQQIYQGQAHPDLAQSLNNLGWILGATGKAGESMAYVEQALLMRQKLYQGRDHIDLAQSLNNMGLMLSATGEYGKSLALSEQALAMLQRLYKGQAHTHIAMSLNNLGAVYLEMGELDKARSSFEQALAMRRKIDKGEDHDELAAILNHVGLTLHLAGEHEKSLPYLEQALDMLRRLHKGQDDPHVAKALNNMAPPLMATGGREKAVSYLQDCLAMTKRLHGGRNHPDMLDTLSNLGMVLAGMGRHEEALTHFQQAATISQEFYRDRSHTHLAESMLNLGDQLGRMGRYDEALSRFEQAMAAYRGVISSQFDVLSESQAAVLVGSMPGSLDGYLSFARRADLPASRVYSELWRSKAALSRLTEFRAEKARVTRLGDANALAAWRDLQITRRRLQPLVLRPAGDPDRDKAVAELTELKERQERDLAKYLPPSVIADRTTSGPEGLSARLPAGSVFIDFFRYRDFAAKRPEDHYVAFVTGKGLAPVRVELGPAGPIDGAVRDWRRSLVSEGSDPPPPGGSDGHRDDDRPGPALRRLIWEPIADRLPSDTSSLYISADGDLLRLPFAALPGSKPGTVLLEEYAIGHVPHGPFLLAHLDPGSPSDASGAMLVVGDVAYDVPGGKAGHPYVALPATGMEMAQLLKVTGDRTVRSLTGGGATATKVANELERTSYAHIATHGFFAEGLVNAERERLEERRRDRFTGAIEQSVGAALRNPLAYVGLVFAGANDPPPDSEDRCILTGDVIVGLDLSGMRLAVLSACETGLGSHTGGEGVYGLQRAFHMAGCRQVVCSLWQVDDEATAALMAKFYHELWVEKKPPIEALRQAQLTVYRHPERIPALARSRGFEFDETAKRPADRPAGKGETTPPKLWAAFVLSGVGG